MSSFCCPSSDFALDWSMEELRFYLNLTGNRQYNNNKIESLEIYMGTDLDGHRTFNAREIPGLRQLTEYPIFIGN